MRNNTKQHLSAVTGARDNQIRHEVNDFVQRVSRHIPDSDTTTYAYDAAGNPAYFNDR